MNCLIVAAHPDDEVLGAGATAYQLASSGWSVGACILSGGVMARARRPSDEALNGDMERSARLLGIQPVIAGDFPNIAFNTVPHLQLVQFVEQAILETKADLVITHHPADTNNDHLHTSLSCQAAIRLFQRRDHLPPVKELWFMEVPSATDWSVNIALNPFTPNTFIPVGEEGLEHKLDALASYRDVMRIYPHPRSREAIRGLAAYRGGQAGMLYAEAFACVFRRGL